MGKQWEMITFSQKSIRYFKTNTIVMLGKLLKTKGKIN